MNMDYYWRIPEAIRFTWGRIPFDQIAAQNREFIAGLDDPTFDRGTRMDATRNNATIYLQDATEFVCIYPQGSFPVHLAKEMVETSLELLKRLSKDYPPAVIKPLEHAYNRYFGCWFGPNIQRVPKELFAKHLFDSLHNMLKAIDDFNVYVAVNPPRVESETSKRGRGRPVKSDKSPQPRGPKNTRMMKVERKEVITYLEIDCHRTVDSCTLGDCTYVWNRPENKTIFDRAASAADSTRGYPNPAALCNAIIYHNNLAVLRAQRKRAGFKTK